MILRRSAILMLGSVPLLARGAFSQTAVKARRVGLLSSGAPVADTSRVFQARLCCRNFSAFRAAGS
jgi:hypothetical protein